MENDIDITLSNKQITLDDIPRLTHISYYPRRRLHLFVSYKRIHFRQKNKHGGIYKKSYTTVANREMRSSLSHRFSREALFFLI